jgi:hypothetical protein
MRRSGPPPNPPVSRKPLMTAPASDRLVPYGGTDPTRRWRSERTLRIPALGVFPAENVKNFRGSRAGHHREAAGDGPVPRLTWEVRGLSLLPEDLTGGIQARDDYFARVQIVLRERLKIEAKS